MEVFIVFGTLVARPTVQMFMLSSKPKFVVMYVAYIEVTSSAS